MRSLFWQYFTTTSSCIKVKAATGHIIYLSTHSLILLLTLQLRYSGFSSQLLSIMGTYVTICVNMIITVWHSSI